MRLNIVTKSTVPPPPYATDLVCIPIAAVPFTLGALVVKSQKYWYASRDDWHAGRKLLASFGKALLMGCAQDIVNAIDRVYNLLDAGMNAVEREVSGTGTDADPFVYAPDLIQAPAVNARYAGGFRLDLIASRAYLDNLTNGTTSGFASDPRSFRDQLENIRALLEASGADSDDIEGILNLILLALA